MTMEKAELLWRCDAWPALSPELLYALLAVRAAVFVVEQDCAYQDLDGLDQSSWHVMALEPGGAVAAYARLVPPGGRFAEPSIGRVLTTARWRGTGLGRDLMRRALAVAGERFPGQANRISAQAYLQRFYSGLGYQCVRGPYPEDGIPHLEMLRAWASEQGER